MIDKDYQWNHNYIREDITTESGGLTKPGKHVSLRTSVLATSIFDARNTMTWRMWGPTCSDTVCIDARRMKVGDRAGLAAFNSDAGLLSIRRDKGQYRLVMSEESVTLSNDKKEITDVTAHDIESITLPKGKTGRVWLRIDAEFVPQADTAHFYYSLDGKQWKKVGSDFKCRFDFMRFFMGARFAVFYYSTVSTGGRVRVDLQGGYYDRSTQLCISHYFAQPDKPISH